MFLHMHTRKDSLSPHSRPTIPNPDTHMYPLTNEFYSLKNEHHDKQRSAYTHKFTNIPPYMHLMHMSIQLRNLCSCKKNSPITTHKERHRQVYCPLRIHVHTHTHTRCPNVQACPYVWECFFVMAITVTW